jgi:hypothetical protein
MHVRIVTTDKLASKNMLPSFFQCYHSIFPCFLAKLNAFAHPEDPVLSKKNHFGTCC